MKVSLNWIKQFIDFELPPIDELVERIGSQLGEVDGVENLGAKYQGVVVAKVVSCDDHPNADRLHVCTIDDGGITPDVNRDENGHVQVVCGAPNVRAGIMVAWLPPRSTVPESVGKEPFVLEARELRGVVSNGMLASPRELALGDSHEGILEIDKADVTPGTPFAEVYKLDDYVIDIENKMFTHRPDCFGVLGVAREVAGILGHEFKSPEWYQPNPAFASKSADLPLTVNNEIPQLVPRFSAVTMANVKIGPSPTWLQVALAKVGQKSINNIVDLTNFYMLVTGQPLHAYDYDKVAALSAGNGAEITVRFPRPGEQVALLNGKTIEPRQEAMMIAGGNQLIGVGGVMGGSDTEVSNDTQNIIIEAASFDMYSIRRTSMAHGLFTDAVTRFNKGQSPLQTLAVLAKIISDIEELASGQVASDLIDVNQAEGREWVHPPVPVTVDFVNTRLGFSLSADDMKRLLQNVEFTVAVENDVLKVTAPFWRTDIETREDVVEEIGRLYGFDKLPLVLPQRSIKPVTKNAVLELKNQLRLRLAAAGANEVLTYSFVHGDLLKKAGQDAEHAFRIDNALSPDLQYYRLSLMPSLLGNVHANIKAGHDEFVLFELGKGHIANQLDQDGLPREDDLTTVVIAAADKLQKPGAPYYAARKYLTSLLRTQLTFKPVPEDMRHFDITKPYEMNRSAFVYAGETFLGIIGEFRSSVRKALKLPAYCAGFELDTGALANVPSVSEYVPLPRFPKVTQDLTLKVSSALPYQELFDIVWAALGTAQPDNTLPHLGPRGIYQPEGADHKNVTFRFEIASYERTLTDAEVTVMLDTAVAAARERYGAERL